MYICVMSYTYTGCVVGTEVSTRMVSEYKSKFQIAESENTRLEGTVSHFNACIHVMLAVQLLSNLCILEGRGMVSGV